MSSTGQALGAITGAVIGFFATGGNPLGALYGAQVGMGVGGLIDPPKGPTIHGPRLSDLTVQTSTYGAHIPRVYGEVASGGNVFWLEGNKLKEVVKKKKSGGKGGGGGSSTSTYSYYATFAVGICKGPIGGIRRIWIGSKLVYDAAAPADSVAQLTSKGATAAAVNPAHIYLGTDDQQPDPRMQADRGVANTPAYRGLAYIVFYDYPLADHGNSLLGAQVKVEVAQVTTTVNAVEVYDLSVYDNYLDTFVYNPLLNEIWAVQHFPNGITRIDADTGALIGHIATPSLCYGAIKYNPVRRIVTCSHAAGLYVFSAQFATYERSMAWGALNYIYLIDVTNASTWSVTGFSSDWSGAVWVASGSAEPAGTNGVLKKIDPINDAVLAEYSIGMAPLRMAFDGNGRIWMIRWGVGDYSAPMRLSVFEPGFGVTADYNVTAGTWANDVLVYDSDRNSLWLEIYQTLDRHDIIEFDIDTRTFGPVKTLPYQWSDIDAANPVAYDASRQILWVGGEYGMLMGVDTATGVVVTTVDLGNDYGIWQSADVEVHNGVIWVCDGGTGLIARIVPFNQTVTDVTLDEIVSAECLQSGLLSAADIDVTALAPQVVRGYRVTQTGAIRGALDPLQAAWPFDVVQAGYTIDFIPRGTASVATITAEELDARADGDSPGAQVILSREMDTQMPRRLTLGYLDPAREYDPGEQSAERLNTASINVRESELPIVLTATEAAGMAERLLHLYWLERTEVGPFKLPPTYLALEPADVITVTTDDATYQLRLTSVHYLPDGRLECHAKLDATAVYTPAALGEEGDATGGATVVLKGPTVAQMLDIPLIRQSESVPGCPVAITGYLAGWPGGILYRSTDAGQTWEDIAAMLPPGSNIGAASNSIGAGRTDIIDTANALTVNMHSALESVTELQLLAGANLFAYGADGRWEIISAQDCTLQGDGSWVLTNLLRGRYGSEWAMTAHAAGDTVVSLTEAGLQFVPVESSVIGLGRLYRAITAGASVESEFDTPFTYRGVNLECLAPVYLNGNRHPSTNDWTLTWLRRTRYGGEWRDFVDATLAETAESYEVEIYDSAYTTLKRTLTATSATVAYTSAQQVTDWGSNQSTLYVKIYQMSDVVGRGYPLTTSITR
jgi:hypothetical protein